MEVPGTYAPSRPSSGFVNEFREMSHRVVRTRAYINEQYVKYNMLMNDGRRTRAGPAYPLLLCDGDASSRRPTSGIIYYLIKCVARDRNRTRTGACGDKLARFKFTGSSVDE